MKFIKNQDVQINYNEIISNQDISTPGIYKSFIIVPNRQYKIILDKFVNNNNNINLWIGNNNKKVLYKGDPINICVKFRDIEKNSIFIGLLFEKCSIGSKFYINDIKLISHCTANINDLLLISGKNIINERIDDNNINININNKYKINKGKEIEFININNENKLIKNENRIIKNNIINKNNTIDENNILFENNNLNRNKIKYKNDKNILPENNNYNKDKYDKNNYINDNIKRISPYNVLWENLNNNKQLIEMTVALPIYEGEKIVELTLESLKNQEKINFGWELIILEEYGKSLEIIKKFINKLPGCQRIIYKILNVKHSILDKWLEIANLASDTSRIYVMQMINSYSPKYRLYIHYEHFNNPNCYQSTQLKGLFYDSTTNKKIFYIGANRKINQLNTAYKLDAIKLINRTEINNEELKGFNKENDYKSKDEIINDNIKILVEELLNNDQDKIISHDSSTDVNNWKYGFIIDGYNDSSQNRKLLYDNPIGIFYNYDLYNKKLSYINMDEYLPSNVLNILSNINNKSKNKIQNQIYNKNIIKENLNVKKNNNLIKLLEKKNNLNKNIYNKK